MNRRKFVIGMGALVAGTSAAVGSGAFSSVQAERDVTVEVADDASAFLALSPSQDPNGDFVNGEGGEVSIDFTETDAGGNNSGSGINDRAYTIFESVLEVKNLGTQSVKVGVDGIDAGPAEFQVYQSRTDLNYDGGSPSQGEQGLRLDQSASLEDLPEIETGEGITIGFAFNLEQKKNFDIPDETLTIVAGTEDRLSKMGDYQ